MGFTRSCGHTSRCSCEKRSASTLRRALQAHTGRLPSRGGFIVASWLDRAASPSHPQGAVTTSTGVPLIWSRDRKFCGG